MGHSGRGILSFRAVAYRRPMVLPCLLQMLLLLFVLGGFAVPPVCVNALLLPSCLPRPHRRGTLAATGTTTTGEGGKTAKTKILMAMMHMSDSDDGSDLGDDLNNDGAVVVEIASKGGECGGGDGCGCGGKGKQKTKTAPKNHYNNYKVLSGYFPDPSFRVMNTGEGIVAITKAADEGGSSSDCRCQFAQFGPRASFSGRVEWTTPREAHTPLAPLALETNGDGVIAVVKRGLCSFESKMRAARAGGAQAVILVNDDDETFLAISDAAAAAPAMTETTDVTATPQPPPQPTEEDIPFVVMPSSAGPALKDGAHVSVETLEANANAGQSKCWGSWDTIDTSEGGTFVLPLFPVSKEPLLPGTELQMRLGKRECDELEHHLRNQQQQQHSMDSPTSTVVHVAVAYCIDPATNVLAETACLAAMDLEDRAAKAPGGRQLTVKGIKPCELRTLVRDSTKAGLGLGLVALEKESSVGGEMLVVDDEDEGIPTVLEQRLDAEVRKKLRESSISAHTNSSEDNKDDIIGAIDAEILALPADPVGLSFAACAPLDLLPREKQAALASSTVERLEGVIEHLNQVASRNRKITELPAGRELQGINDNNFVARAVEKVLPSVVRVELPGRSGNAGSGFVIGSDGLIATNRHVVVSEVGAEGDGDGPVTVTFQDGLVLPARVLAVSENHDIAFLKVVETNDGANDNDAGSSSISHLQSAGENPTKGRFPVVSLGNGDNVTLGDWMIAVGSPATEFENLVSLGIASAIQRPKSAIKNNGTNKKVSSKITVLDRSASFIGTDALFHKGMSGGPLINDIGDVVGMCTYRREDLNGLGFAISINLVLEAQRRLIMDMRDGNI